MVKSLTGWAFSSTMSWWTIDDRGFPWESIGTLTSFPAKGGGILNPVAEAVRLPRATYGWNAHAFHYRLGR